MYSFYKRKREKKLHSQLTAFTVDGRWSGASSLPCTGSLRWLSLPRTPGLKGSPRVEGWFGMCLLSDVMLGQAPGLTPIHVDTVFKVGRAHCDAWTLQQTLEMTRCPFQQEPEAQSTRQALAWRAPRPHT